MVIYRTIAVTHAIWGGRGHRMAPPGGRTRPPQPDGTTARWLRLRPFPYYVPAPHADPTSEKRLCNPQKPLSVA